MTTTPNIWVEDAPAANTEYSTWFVGLSDGRVLALVPAHFAANPTEKLLAGKFFDADGSQTGSLNFLLGDGFPEIYDHRYYVDVIATDDGGIAVAHRDASGDQLRFVRFDAQGQITDEQIIATADPDVEQFQNPSLTMFDNGDFAVTFWRAQQPSGNNFLNGIVLNEDGTVQHSEFQAGSNSDQPGGQQVDILSNGNIVVANVDNVITNKVKFTILDSSGNILVGPTIAGDDVLNDLVALKNGGFVIARGHNSNDDELDVYDNQGNRIGAAIAIVDGANDLVALADGGFVNIGRVYDSNTNSYEYVVQRYDAQGDEVGGSLQASASVSLATETADGRIALLDMDGETLTILDPRDAGDLVLGGSADDHLTAPVPGGTVNGRGGVDRVYGHNGDDTFIDNDGLNGEHYDGGDGIDTIDYSASTLNGGAFNFIDLSAGETLNLLSEVTGTLVNVENVEGSQGSETIIDDFGTSVINANGGNDRVRLAESLINGDIYDGGAGTDTLDLTRFDWNPNFDPIIDLAAETLTAAGAEAIRNFENIEGGEGSNGGVENLLGTNGVNIIDGNGGDDVITGRGMAGQLSGGDGDDIFVLSGLDVATGETIDGGDGTDTLKMVGGQTFQFGAATLASIEAVTFDAFAGERIARFDATQFGGGGIAANTLITGNTGVTLETLDITMGTDTALDLSGLQFARWFFGGDRLVITGDADAEVIGGSRVNDTINAGDGADDISGNGGNDTINAGGGNDIVRGGGGTDIMDGGAGGDTAAYDDATGGVTVSLAITTQQATGASGFDTLRNFENLAGSAFADTLTGDRGKNMIAGGAGDDVLAGDEGDDMLSGGLGDDMLAGGAGADMLDGGDDADTADYAASEDAVEIDLAAGGGSGGHAEGDRYQSIENVTGSAFNDRLYGDRGVNILNGLDGVDALNGGDSNDTLHGGADGDRLYGEGDADTLYGDAGNDVVNGGAGDDILYGGADHDLMGGVAGNDRIYGEDGNDTLYGNEGNDLMGGVGGNDLMYGGIGGDTMYGNDGADRMYGEDQDDLLYGGIGDDLVNGGSGNDRLYAEDGDDTLGGASGDDLLNGGAGNDTLYGNDGNDTLGGVGGNDLIYGGAGNDAMYGNAGSDRLYGENDDDTIYGHDGNDVVNGGEGNDFLYGGIGNDVMGGVGGADRLYGEAGHDDLYGNDGADMLFGDTGTDRLTGGAGNDYLNGGAEADRFIFDDGWGDDVVADFQNGVDKFDLTAVAGLTSFGQLDITYSGGSTYVEFNGDQFRIFAVNVGLIDSSDFIL